MWRVLLLNTKDRTPNLSIVRSVEDALRQHPSVSGVWNAEYPDALHTAIHQQCNLLLAVDSVWLDRGLCRRLAHVCGTSCAVDVRGSLQPPGQSRKCSAL